MRVLLFPVGSSGDVHPFVALGRRLVARGHDVTLFGNGHFGAPADRQGERAASHRDGPEGHPGPFPVLLPEAR